MEKLYDEYKKYRIYVIKPNLSIFHITKKNLPINNRYGENPYLLNLKTGESVIDLNLPIFLSLDEDHTIYYDVWDKSTHQWASDHFKGETTKFLKLIDFGKNKPNYSTDLYNFIIDTGLDGWVAYDDYPELWREIYIHKPKDKIIFTEKLKHGYVNVPNVYPKEAALREQISLNKHVISSNKLKNLIIN